MNTCKCGNTDDYNFALDIGLCNGCIAKKLEENRFNWPVAFIVIVGLISSFLAGTGAYHFIVCVFLGD